MVLLLMIQICWELSYFLLIFTAISTPPTLITNITDSITYQSAYISTTNITSIPPGDYNFIDNILNSLTFPYFTVGDVSFMDNSNNMSYNLGYLPDFPNTTSRVTSNGIEDQELGFNEFLV